MNVYFNRLEKPGKLTALDFEDETQETFGVGKIEDFTQHQMIDLYACVECGRCTSMCPATGTGKLLSPMDLIVKMRDHLTRQRCSGYLKTPWVPPFAFAHTTGNQLPLASAALKREELRYSTWVQPKFNWRCHNRRGNLGMHNLPKL